MIFQHRNKLNKQSQQKQASQSIRTRWKCHRFCKIPAINILIGGIPFLIFLVALAPVEKEWHTVFGVIGSYGFLSVKAFVYTIMQRIVLLLILLVSMFLTSRTFIYGYIVAISLQVYRIVGIFNPGVQSLDKWEWVFVIPIWVITVWLLWKLHAQIHRKLDIIEAVEEIDKKLEELREKKKIG